MEFFEFKTIGQTYGYPKDGFISNSDSNTLVRLKAINEVYIDREDGISIYEDRFCLWLVSNKNSPTACFEGTLEECKAEYERVSELLKKFG